MQKSDRNMHRSLVSNASLWQHLPFQQRPFQSMPSDDLKQSTAWPLNRDIRLYHFCIFAFNVLSEDEMKKLLGTDVNKID